MEKNSTPSKEIISVMMELKEKVLEQSERRKQMEQVSKQITLRLTDEVYGALKKAENILGFNRQNLILLAIHHSIGTIKCKHKQQRNSQKDYTV